MPGLSPQEYSELQALVGGPDHGLTPDELARANQAIADFNQQYETGMRGGVTEEQALAMGPPTPEDDLVSKLNPQFSLIPQALSVQPATTHQGGDQAARAEWLGGAPNGPMDVFYDPPVDAVKQKLLANPQLAVRMFPNIGKPFSPEEIANLQKGDDIYDTYVSMEWRKAADASAKAGRTAYRYSKADWLHDGKLAHTLNKLGGFAEVGPRSLILGLDDAAMFGASQALEEKLNPEAAELNQRASEEAPLAGGAGLGIGMLSGWAPANRLWDFVTSGGRALGGAASKLPGLSRAGGASRLAGRVGVSAGAASVAAGAEEGIKGLVAGEGLSGAAERGEAGFLSPLAPLMGGAGELLGSAAGKVGEWTRHGGYFGGAPGRLEAQGVEFKFGGPTPPKGSADAVRAGRKEDVSPVDPSADQLAPELERGAKEIRAERVAEIEEINRPFYESREGKMRLPISDMVGTVTKELRSDFQREGKRLRPVPGRKARINEYRAALAETVGGVSLEPVEGAVEVTLEEAARFLPTSLKRKLVPDTPPPKGGGDGPSGGGAGGARDVDLVSVGDTPKADVGARVEQQTMDVDSADIEDVPDVREAATIPPKGKAARPAGKVEGPPERDITPTVHQPEETRMAIREADEALSPGRSARAAEAKRMESLAAEGSRGPVTTPPPPLPKTDSGLMDTVKSLQSSKTGMTQVADVVRAMGGDTKAAHAAILKAYEDGLIELRPEGGLGRLSKEELANSIPGPQGTRLSTIRILGTAGAATAAGAAGDEEDAGTAAAAAGFVTSLKKRGATKVYLVPRRLNAQQHERMLKTYRERAVDADNPNLPASAREKARESAILRDAAYRDRDARPMDGKPGGWSESQQRAAKALEEAEAIQKRVGRGDQAFRNVVDYGVLHPGQLRDKRALEAAAKRVSLEDELSAVRALDPWRQINNSIEFGQGRTDQRGLMRRAADAAHLRAGYPAVRRMEDPQSLMRGGRLGRFSLLRGNSLAMPAEEEEKR